MSGRVIVERYAAAFAANDSAMMRECLDPDYVGRYPQSGEVIRGIENRLAVGENFPGQDERKLSATVGEIRGRDDEFVSAPSWPAWTIVHLIGSGDDFTLTGTVTYPNGEIWHAVMVVTVRGGKVWRETDYFAPPFEAAAWREPFVERT